MLNMESENDKNDIGTIINEEIMPAMDDIWKYANISSPLRF
jgi:hypothetical protein